MEEARAAARGATARRASRCAATTAIRARCARRSKTSSARSLRGFVHIERRELAQLTRESGAPTGLLVTNPPYGERIGDQERLQALYATLGAEAARALRGLEGRGAHRQSAACEGDRHQRAAHAHAVQRPHRMPLAAFRRDARGLSRRASGTRRRRSGDARAAGRADVREPPAQESQVGAGVGAARSRSIAIASTTPTCPSTRSRSISTATARASAGPSCRNMRRRKPSSRRRRGSVATKRSRSFPHVLEIAARTDVRARAPAAEGRRAVREGRARARVHIVREAPTIRGELQRLSRHRAVPRSSTDAPLHRRAGARQALPESVRLHGHGDGLRGRRRRARHRRPSTCRAPISTGRSAIWR